MATLTDVRHNQTQAFTVKNRRGFLTTKCANASARLRSDGFYLCAFYGDNVPTEECLVEDPWFFFETHFRIWRETITEMFC